MVDWMFKQLCSFCEENVGISLSFEMFFSDINPICIHKFLSKLLQKILSLTTEIVLMNKRGSEVKWVKLCQIYMLNFQCPCFNCVYKGSECLNDLMKIDTE